MLKIKVTREIAKTLRDIKIEPITILPVMTDDEYNKIKYIMEYAGGHWREKYHGFQFDGDIGIAYNILNSAIIDGGIILSNEVEFRIKNQFYPTPDKTAEQMVKLAEITPRDTVLEPSAGRGAILKHIVSHKIRGYTAVEINRENFHILGNEYGYEHLVCLSFETFYSRSIGKKSFSKIIMNPPFSNKRDIMHTMMAYNLLKPGGRLVGLLAENSLYYNRPITTKFNSFLKSVDSQVTEIPHGTFKSSGTLVDVVCVVINKDKDTKIDLSGWN